MTNVQEARRHHLIIAAVLAGAAGLGLIALGWWVVGWYHEDGWSRFSDSSWWAGSAIRTLGALLISKAGFKGALALVFVVVAATAAVRRRRARRSTVLSVDAASAD